MSRVRRGAMAADQFSTVSNAFARDARLTLKARGLGLWLFTHQDGWNLSVRSIAKQVGAGVESVQSGLKELEEFGYLRREQANESGRFGEMDYIVTDIPAGDTAYRKPVHGGPAEESTDDRESDTHKKTKFQVDQPEEHQEETPASTTNGSAVMDGGLFVVDAPSNGDAPASEIDGPTFDEFWSVYPLKKAKQGARQSWERALFRVPKADRAERARAIVAGAKRYAEDPDRTAKYTAHATTWLNQGRWEDEVNPVGSGRTPRGGGARYRDSEGYPGETPWFDPAALEDT